MKKIFRQVSIPILFLLFLWGFSCKKPSKEGEMIKIGAILPLTGPSSPLGIKVKQGIVRAVEEFGKEKNIKIIFVDSQGSPRVAAYSFQRLVGFHNTPIVISSGTSVTKALIPLADKNRVILFGTLAAVSKLTERSPWVFRYYYTPDLQGAVIARFMLDKKGIKKVVVLYVDDEYGVLGFTSFKDSLGRYGGEAIGLSFKGDTKELRPLLKKASGFHPEGVLIIAYEDALVSVLKEIKEFGIVETPVFTYRVLADYSVLRKAGEAAEGVYLTFGDYNPSSPATPLQERFVENYEKEYGRLPPHYAAFGYDIIRLIVQALEDKSSNPKKIREKLLKINKFKGVMGDLSVLPNREVSFPVKVMRIQEGTTTPVP